MAPSPTSAWHRPSSSPCFTSTTNLATGSGKKKHYRRAVYSMAKADLIERYRDIDSTASSLTDKKSMEWMNDAPSEQRRNAHWAVADILGRTHATVELI